MEIEKELVKLGYKLTTDGRLVTPTKITNGTVTSTGYLATKVLVGNKRYNVKLHRLQAYQKFGDELYGSNIVVRHINDDKQDNSWDNIDIGTYSDNAMDRSPKLRKELALNAAKSTRKLSEEQLQLLRTDRERGLSLSFLSKKYSISKSTVSYIVNNKTYKTL